MSRTVYLHIGAPKTGTTYLQDVLSSGVLEPAGGWYVGGTFGAQTPVGERARSCEKPIWV